MELNFTGKTVLVTGAAQGAGKVIAEKYLAAGAKVIAADLRMPEWTVESGKERYFPIEIGRAHV